MADQKPSPEGQASMLTNGTTGVAVIWGPPDYGDITSNMGMRVTISLNDMRLPQLHITLAVWESLVIYRDPSI